ncbi:hypothetical protein BKA93DRAFT_374346 [Sparassis latifolia]
MVLASPRSCATTFSSEAVSALFGVPDWDLPVWYSRSGVPLPLTYNSNEPLAALLLAPLPRTWSTTSSSTRLTLGAKLSSSSGTNISTANSKLRNDVATRHPHPKVVARRRSFNFAWTRTPPILSHCTPPVMMRHRAFPQPLTNITITLTRPLHTGIQEWGQVLCAKMRLVGPYHPAPATETTVVIKIF